jgi:hypothetical protein
MKRNSFIISLLMLLFGTVEKTSAQYYFYNSDYYDTKVVYEVGGSLAAMNCLTDIGGNKGIGKPFVKDLNYGNTKFAGSAYLSATYKYAVGLRVEATFGQIGAYDSILKSVQATTGGRYERNLSFRSSISEVALIAEFHPLYMFIDWTDKDRQPPSLSPYLLAGIGFYSFDPQALLGNQWVDLQPLRTEGEGFKEYPNRKEYSLHQTNIPVGFGLRYEATSMLNIRAEFILRVLHTDYLDDVSTRYIDPSLFAQYLSGNQLTDALILNERNKNLNPKFSAHPGGIRGNPNNNDSYFTFNLKLGLVMGREKVN